jgi:hypothetical protein
LTLQVPRELNVSVLRRVRAPSRAPFPKPGLLRSLPFRL